MSSSIMEVACDLPFESMFNDKLLLIYTRERSNLPTLSVCHNNYYYVQLKRSRFALQKPVD